MEAPSRHPFAALPPRLRPQPQQQHSAPAASPSQSRFLRDTRHKALPTKSSRSIETPAAATQGGKSRGVGGVGALGSNPAIGSVKTKVRKGSGAPPKPLLPVTERRSQEERKSQEDEKWEIAPDGGSGGREGRKFAVSNVGNNGRIYLRPTIRPANQRYPQPSFAFPSTPPGTAVLDTQTLHKDEPQANTDTLKLPATNWTPTHAPSTPTTAYFADRKALGRPGHRRTVSDSTVPDTDLDGFKVVINQRGQVERSKEAEDINPSLRMLLEVAIPTWKLGTPRFDLKGTPFIRGSSYAPTEEFRGSVTHPSVADFSNRTSPVLVPQIQVQGDGTQPRITITSPRFPPPLRATYMSTHLVIEPGMFDALTFKPACDDRSIVRYSYATGAVTAATPPRLVAEITSPSFVDYDLLSDFFLTFRAFLEANDLLRMLVARLQWALVHDDPLVGIVVRVRTFVALRHWILNYFMDDFVVDHALRVTFCNLINDLVDEVYREAGGIRSWLKMLSELKKCWRRVCAQYWDGPGFDDSLSPDAPISPGGIAGHRDPTLDPTFWEKAEEPKPEHTSGAFSPNPARTERSFYIDGTGADHIDSVIHGVRPTTPETPPDDDELQRTKTSPTSMGSMDAVSCSLPTKHLRPANNRGRFPSAPAAHPADPSSIYASTDPIAPTPKALTGKRVRPQPNDRHASATDSMRLQTRATEKVIHKNAELLMALPYVGSLVRGNGFPPGQAFVEILPPSAADVLSRQVTLPFQTHPTGAPKDKLMASAMSGQGMRKLLGNVRRALSTRGQAVSPTQGTFINISPLGPRTATTNRLPGTAIVPQARPRTNGVRPPVRIDLLGAEIAEDFKKAVRDNAAAEAERQHGQGYLAPPAVDSSAPLEMLEYSAAHMNSISEPRPMSDMAITAGSKSIVIVDDTLPIDFPVMAGALPLVNSSVEAFGELLVPVAADPTPPNTPPGQSIGTPRRSSYILRQHIGPSGSSDDLGLAASDIDPLYGNEEPKKMISSGEDSFSAPSPQILRSSSSRPPLSGILGHARHRSSRSNRSNRSLALRRHASFTSGIAPQPTIRSFDATTYSEASIDDVSDVPETLPLRVLRRRPGGDLRAVANIGDLASPGALTRSRSLGSLTTFSESARSSCVLSPARDSGGFVEVVNSDYSRDRVDAFSLGAVAQHNPKRDLSLFSTHSSKPIMRPSFEAEAQKLAQIPDDAEDDGGVESALLKLEGRYDKKNSPRSSVKATASLEVKDEPSTATGRQLNTPVSRQEKLGHRHVHVGADELHSHQSQPSAETVNTMRSFLDVPSSVKPGKDVGSLLSEDSPASYSSIPLLERGLTDDGKSKKTDTNEWTNRSILQDPEDGTPEDEENPLDSPHASFELVPKTASLERIRAGEAIPRPDAPRHSAEESFLDVGDDDSDDSDLSSEMSADVGGTQGLDVSRAVRDGAATSPLPLHPLGEHPPFAQLSPLRRPPSPPMTFAQALQMTPPTLGFMIPTLQDHQIWGEKPLPPTPDTAPTSAGNPWATRKNDPVEIPGRQGRIDIPDIHARQTDQLGSTLTVHLPFILAFESDVLAQQFTLIEKDALNEIDWKELIDMRWKNAEQDGINTRSWVTFLRDSEARGVEVVIARFNIMVKWAVSEIVLTQDWEERARCIVKYIHIAAHCRRYRNFATTVQIVIALTSNDVRRLGHTWALVPQADRKILRDLEALISPTRNFHSLRWEMEGGGALGAASADMGCIPFVCIYTHDLLFNAQRPSEIASSPTAAPLVNFERCRIAAAVVKTLLRLLEASTRYDFQPIEGITERCLWMSALSDEEIRRHSQSLE